MAQLVRSVTGENLAETVSVESSHAPAGSGVRLTADVRTSTGDFHAGATLELTAFGTGARPRRLDVERVGPGLFEATLDRITYGRDEQFAWRLGNDEGNEENNGDGNDVRTFPYGFTYSFSPEYRTLAADQDTLDQMNAHKTGEQMRLGETRLVVSTRPSLESMRLWPWLLLAGILLVPFDLLCRRLG